MSKFLLISLILLTNITLAQRHSDYKSELLEAIYDPQDRPINFTRITLEQGLSQNSAYCILQDSKGFIWIGTEDGLNRFDGYSFTHFKHDPANPNTLSDNYVRCLLEDSQGTIWIGTWGGGLNRFDPRTKRFSHYKNDPKDPRSLSDNVVYSLLEDSQGTIWIGTKVGLNYFVPAPLKKTGTKLDVSDEKVKFLNYNEHNSELPNDVVYGMVEDDEGNIWGSTNKGIFKFTVNTSGSISGVFRNYDVSDGLQSNEFNSGAFDKGKSGLMYFGGINGFNAFHPDSVKDNSFLPKMVITDFKIFNESVLVIDKTDSLLQQMTNSEEMTNDIIKIGDKFYLPQSINYTKKITISYKESVFTIEFAGLHFANPEKNQYAYKLEGFDEDWNYAGTRRFATYTNLDAGKYTFKLKGSNNDGVWIEDSPPLTPSKGGRTGHHFTPGNGSININNSGILELNITITPPWWETWWFNTSWVLSLIAVVIGYIKRREQNLKRAKIMLEQKVQERTEELSTANEEITQSNEELNTAKEELEQTNLKLNEANVELEKLAIVASQTDNAVMIADKNGKLEWVNEGFTRFTGYTFDEYIKAKGKTMAEISGNAEIKEVINKCMKTKKTTVYESMNITKDGREIWVQTTLTPIIENGSLKKLVAIDSDITERRRVEEEIKEKNKDVTDSIRAAQIIQQAMLPPDAHIKRYFAESFILYKPRDIVSGDFYYSVRTSDELVILAVCDCTGHGVPGAFVSILCNNLLNEVIVNKNITQPDKILHQVNSGIIERFHQRAVSKVQDGMDVALCSFNVVNGHAHSLQYSGAYNPLYLIRNNELNIYEAAKCSLGGMLNADFILHKIKIKKGDVMYLFSDGYQDQWGGEKGKRFSKSKFKDLVLGMHQLPMKEQKEMLEKNLEKWMDHPDPYEVHSIKQRQVDDITVIGVRF